MVKFEQDHIRHLKKHRNFLYGLVVLLLVIQTAYFVSISGQISRLDSKQISLDNKIEKNSEELTDSIDSLREDNQYKINEISKELVQQKKDVQSQISLLKAGQEDFSGVINDVIKGVVNVATDKSAGTGFFVDSSGYVVTNEHVISGSTFVRILTYDGREYNAEVVGSDVKSDVAVLKVTGVFDSLNFENSNDLQVGEKVIAIGNPLGLSFTVTEGIISALDRKGPNGLNDYIQTDVTLNPGNSGGPLITKEGKVAGINNFKIGGAESLGFALDGDVVGDVANKIANKTIVDFD